MGILKSLFKVASVASVSKNTLEVKKILIQYSPYGVVVYSVWGEESEDKVFEEYKKINELLAI